MPGWKRKPVRWFCEICKQWIDPEEWHITHTALPTIILLLALLLESGVDLRGVHWTYDCVAVTPTEDNHMIHASCYPVVVL